MKNKQKDSVEKTVITPQSRRLDFEVLFERSSKTEKVMTMGLVSDRRDSYRTVIKPDGCTTPIESVLVDYNHNFINTGSYMEDLGIQKREVPTGNALNPFEKIDMRIVDVHVPVTAKAWTKDNKEKPAVEVPSLYEFVESGRVRWGSVYFEPDKDAIEIVTNSDGKVLREVYNKWELVAFSLLDVPPGQSTSYTFNVRSLNYNKRTKMDFNEIKELISGLLKAKGMEFKILTGIVVTMLSETEGKIHFILDESDDKEYEVTYTVADDKVVLGDEIKPLTEEQENAEEEIDEKKSDASEGARTEGVESADEKVYSDETDGKESKIADDAAIEGKKAIVEDKARYACIGEAVKNIESGVLGKVVSTVTVEGENGQQVSTATIQLTDGTQVVVNSNQIGGRYMSDSSEVVCIWSYVTTGDLLDLISAIAVKEVEEVVEPVVDPTPVENVEVQRSLKEEIEEKDEKLKTVAENYDKLRKSPVESRANAISSATDSESGSENSEDSSEDKLARQASRSRFIK